MSRIGKKPVQIPAGVTVAVDGTNVKVSGKGGDLSRVFDPRIAIVVEGEEVVVSPKDDSKEANALHGLSRTLIANMIEGVSSGFQKKLELVGVGYRAALKGTTLELSLGYSHPVVYPAPANISFEVPDNTHIVVKGISKEQVGQVAAEIREKRPPEPYKGKGVRYAGEYVRRKLGKAAK